MIKKIKTTFKILLFAVILAGPILILGGENISRAAETTSTAKTAPYKTPDQRASATGSTSYTPMEEIPGMGKPSDFYDYINAVYKFGIGAIGICAMLMIIVGGYMYITSAGNNSSMEKAKGVITDAIVGLLLAFSSYLILYVINPDLVRIKRMTPLSPTAIEAGATKTGVAAASCSEIPSQVPNQCGDASPQLNSLLSCVSGKVGKSNIQISSISDGNGGLNCYNKYSTQCSGNQMGCCFHKKTSCHYGGTKCSDGSHAVDFSAKGSKASSDTIKSAVISCGGKALDEGNHVHASIGGTACGCDISL